MEGANSNHTLEQDRWIESHTCLLQGRRALANPCRACRRCVLGSATYSILDTHLYTAPLSLLFELLQDLGLGAVRAQRLVHISQAFLADPPEVEKPRPSRGRTTALFCYHDSLTVKEVKYPPTPISHIPGCGPYALDSYRIFCTGGEEWKNVRPMDKELVKYLVSVLSLRSSW